MKFTKMHGLGNDFIVVDMFEETLFDGDSHFAKAICDRHTGVGGDGLVMVFPSDKADCRMKIINSDGREAESCGNALRCVAKFVYERGRSRGTLVSIDALAGVYTTEVTAKDGKAQLIKVNMGLPGFAPSAFPALVDGDGPITDLALTTDRSSYTATLVSVGVPHIVIFVPDVEAIALESEGSQIENDPLFPRGANVNFVQAITPEHLKVRVWERGAGVTQACGTGASAVLAAAVLTGRSPRKATVELPGGEMVIEWKEDGPLYMTGPAVEVFTGEYK